MEEKPVKKAFGFVGWELPAADREILLQLYPATNDDVRAHHVTLKFGVREDVELPQATFGEVVGYLDHEDGVQALVFKIDGQVQRPDGSIYHCTWSLDSTRNKKAHMSNALLQQGLWTKVDPIQVQLVPRFFKS